MSTSLLWGVSKSGSWSLPLHDRHLYVNTPVWTSIIKTPPLLLTILLHNKDFAQELDRIWPVCMKIVSNPDRIPLCGPLILIRGCLIDRTFRYFLNICKTRWHFAQVQQPRGLIQLLQRVTRKLAVPSVEASTDRSSCIVAVAALGSRLFTQECRVALACDTYLNVRWDTRSSQGLC